MTSIGRIWFILAYCHSYWQNMQPIKSVLPFCSALSIQYTRSLYWTSYTFDIIHLIKPTGPPRHQHQSARRPTSSRQCCAPPQPCLCPARGALQTMDVAMDTVQWKRDLAELWSAGMHAYRLNCRLPSCPCLSVDAGALVPHSDADCRLMRSCRDSSDRFNDHRYWTNRNTQLESRSRIGVLFRFLSNPCRSWGGGIVEKQPFTVYDFYRTTLC